MTDVKVEQCDELLAAFIMDDEALTLAQATQAIARHRQAAEKAQQERDAKLAQERAEAYHAIPRVNLLNAARAGEAERIATAIRSKNDGL